MFSRQLLGWGRLCFFLFIFSVGAFYLWWFWSSRPLPPGQEMIFVVSRGESLDGVARKLADQGLIRNAFAFKIWMLTAGRPTQVQAGSFRLQRGLFFTELTHLLATGMTDIWVTFPEGWRSEQYAVRLRQAGLKIDFRVWQELVTNQALEGELFPDTYLIPVEADEKKILAILRANFMSKTPDSLRLLAGERKLDWEKVLIFASLLEREANQPQDRPLVAGVMITRWQEGWPLQLDATVQYALTSQQCGWDWEECEWWPASLSRSDMAIESPFNTYYLTGLPPHPIANPGIEAIGAVINYQPSSYRYYLTDSQGVTHFAASLEEHNANIRRYLD